MPSTAASRSDPQPGWRVLADDLTGALDTAAMWAGAAPVPVYLGAPQPGLAPVQVCTSASRDLPEAALAGVLGERLQWLCGPGRAFKKVDSLLRGNTFAEVAWLLSSGRFAGVVFAPGFPGQGRYTAAGRHWVGPAQAHAPRIPAGARPLIAAFDTHRVQAWVPAAGEDPLSRPGAIAIPDVLDEADLERLAAHALEEGGRDWLWCGSAGLAGALARLSRTGTGSAALPGTARSMPGSRRFARIWLVTASRHPVLRAQLAGLRLAASQPVRIIDLADKQPLPAETAAARLAARAAALVGEDARPDLLVVVGGDTLLALCQAAGVERLTAHPGLRPGWGRADLVGGVWEGVDCHSRSGAFGGPSDLSHLLERLALAGVD